MKAGGLPQNLGVIDANASEMMFVQYMPIMLPNCGFRLPENLKCFMNVIDEALNDYIVNDVDMLYDKYVYLTAKHLYVTPENLGNRPGWHIDGFGTDDINYIWYDGAEENSTEFCNQEFDISTDEHKSMEDMAAQAREENIVVFPVKSLLKLNNQHVHRTSTRAVAGFRTFVKLSVSDCKYNLAGNAHNYLFNYDWSMVARDEQRNVTAK